MQLIEKTKEEQLIEQILYLLNNKFKEIDKDNFYNYKNSINDINVELRKEIYFNRLKANNKTLDKIGHENGGRSREWIRKVEADIKDYLSKEIDKLNEDINPFVENSFEQSINILYADNLNLLEPYKNLIKLYWSDNSDPSNRTFNIDYEKQIIYDKNLDLNNLYKNFKNQLKNENKYTESELKEVIELSILNIAYEVNNEKRIQFSNLLLTLILQKDFINNFVEVSDNEIKKYIYFESPIKTINQRKKIRFLYYFKKVYPQGIPLPQPNKTLNNYKEIEKLVAQNLELLFLKIPDQKTDKYRSFITNKIVSEENIADYDTGRYIHFDYFKNLYNENKDFTDALALLVSKLFNDSRSSVSAWKVFTDLKSEFQNRKIYTFGILFYLLKASNTKLIKFIRQGKTLLFADPDVPLTGEENHINFYKNELKNIKSFMIDNSFNNLIDFDLEDNLAKANDYNGSQNSDALKKEIDKKLIEEIESDSFKETEKEALIKIRIGQSNLRKRLLNETNECAICGLTGESLLIVSHVIPWSDSKDYEKLDLNNVLLLCPNHDVLFDKGFITFSDEGKIIISDILDERKQALLNIHNESKISIKTTEQKYFIKFHRENVFEKFNKPLI